MANQNINLGRFDFDTNALSRQLAELRSQMQAVNVNVKEMRNEANKTAKELAETANKMAELSASGEEGSEEFEKLNSELEQLSNSLTDQNQLLEEAEGNLRVVNQQYKETSNVLRAVTDAENNYVSAKERTNQLLQEEITSIASARQSNSNILAIRNQLRPAIAEEAELMEKLNERLNSNNKFIEENASAYEQRKINIGNYSESVQDALSKIDPFNFSLSQFVQLSQEAGGSTQALTGIFSQLRTGIIGVTKSTLAFIATPIGAALTALAGIGLVAKEFFDYNNSIKESIRLTEQFTGVSGSAGDAIRIQAKAISDTFGADFEEVLVTAQKLVQNFGISYDEALNIVKEGLAEGGVANKEFFDSLKEYPVFFKQAGFSAKEFKDIINTGFDLGIYNDKLPDAIKEAGISLQEQTKATRDALVNAFGASFTDDILKRVRTGQTSVKDALNEIAKESEKANLNQQQLATLTADVFRGAGEDVGGAVKIFEALNVAQQESNKTLSETEKYYLDLANANEELTRAKDEEFKSDSLISFTQQFELMWTKVQTAFYQAVGWAKDIYVEYNRIIGTSESLQNIWTNLSEIGQKIGSFVDRMKVSFQQLASSIGLSGGETNKLVKYLSYAIDPIKKIELILTALNKGFELFSNVVQSATIDLTALVRTAKQAYDSITDLDFSNLANIGKMFMDNRKEVAKDIVLAESRNKALQATNDLMKVLGGLTVENTNITKDAVATEKKDTKDLDKEKQKAFENEIRRMQERIDLFRSEQGFAKKSLEEQLEIERRVAQDSIAILDKELVNKKISREKYQAEVNKINTELASREAEIVIQNAQEELEIWQRTNQELLDQDKVWSDESVKLEEQRLDDLLTRQNKFAETRKINGDITEKELQAIILKNTLDTETKKKEIEDAFNAQKKVERMAIQQAEFEVELIQMEQNGATKFELEQAIRDENFENEMTQLNEQLARKEISLEEFEARKQAITLAYEKDTADATKIMEEEVLMNKVSVASQAYGMLANIAGKESAAGKAFAVAQATMDTYRAATAMYAAGASLGGPAGVIMGPLMAALAVASGLANVKKIVSTKTPKMGGFATGGKVFKGDGIPIQRRPNGDNMLVSVYDGEAVLNPTQQSLIGHDVLRMAGVPGFANGGLNGSMSPIVQNQVLNQINQMELTETISDAVRQGAMEGSALGSASGSQQGIKDLNTDLDIQRRATF